LHVISRVLRIQRLRKVRYPVLVPVPIVGPRIEFVFHSSFRIVTTLAG